MPEHGLAKSRMRQYLEITGHSSAAPAHDQVVDELATKGLAKSLLAKWKSMESVKATESASSSHNHNQHHHHSNHFSNLHNHFSGVSTAVNSERPAHPVAVNLSSRSSANASTPMRRNQTHLPPNQMSRAISKDRGTGSVVVVAPFVEVTNTAEQLPQAGMAKQLLSKWQHNPESST